MKTPVAEDRVVCIRLSQENFTRLQKLITGSVTAYKHDHGDGHIITASLAKRIYKQLWAAAKDGQFEV